MTLRSKIMEHSFGIELQTKTKRFKINLYILYKNFFVIQFFNKLEIFH